MHIFRNVAQPQFFHQDKSGSTLSISVAVAALDRRDVRKIAVFVQDEDALVLFSPAFIISVDRPNVTREPHVGLICFSRPAGLGFAFWHRRDLQ
jgi:hypothetical protein